MVFVEFRVCSFWLYRESTLEATHQLAYAFSDASILVPLPQHMI